jgi:hypothetical protein
MSDMMTRAADRLSGATVRERERHCPTRRAGRAAHPAGDHADLPRRTPFKLMALIVDLAVVGSLLMPAAGPVSS